MVYINRAKQTTHNSKWHLLQATLDLYWAVIDAAHAALMDVNVLPPSPANVASSLNLNLVKKNKLEKKYVKDMEFFYVLSKKIVHGELTKINGKEYDIYLRKAADFVEKMKRIIEI